MEKRYQVFISSTFQDLEGARQEVSEALLRADCFPAGMELFPAADEEQFEYIKTVIDVSDYYIIISAGRYGSIHPETGLSYTEMEYDYAVEIGKPVIRLLHKDPFNELKGEYIEQTDLGREKLEKFRSKLGEARLVRFWEAPKELGLEAFVALTDLKRRSPADGWIKGDEVLDPKASIELVELRSKIEKLQNEAEDTEEYVTGDQRSLRIRKEVMGFTGAHSVYVRSAYMKLLDNVSRENWRFSDMNG